MATSNKSRSESERKIRSSGKRGNLYENFGEKAEYTINNSCNMLKGKNAKLINGQLYRITPSVGGFSKGKFTMDKHGKINLEYYKVFYYVCRSGGITAAADELCISQPAVSQAVRQLETALGCRLFLRTSKGVKLTREGDVLYSYVRKGIESIYDGENTLMRIQNLDTGEIRIGASDMTLQFYLLPYLEKFHERYPNIKVNVSNGPTPETLEFLKEGRIDFGIVSTPFEGGTGVKSLPVKEVDNIFIAGPRFREELEGKKVNYRELLKYPCIFLEKKTSTRTFMDQFLEEKGISLEPEFELATSDMIVQFARRNLGIGCLMSGFAKEALEQEEVFRLVFEEEMPHRQFCIVSSEKAYMSPAAARLFDELMMKL